MTIVWILITYFATIDPLLDLAFWFPDFLFCVSFELQKNIFFPNHLDHIRWRSLWPKCFNESSKSSYLQITKLMILRGRSYFFRADVFSAFPLLEPIQLKIQIIKYLCSQAVETILLQTYDKASFVEYDQVKLYYYFAFDSCSTYHQNWDARGAMV